MSHRSFWRAASLIAAEFSFCRVEPEYLQGYLAHKNLRPHMTLQWDYALGSMVVLIRGGDVFSEQSNPEPNSAPHHSRYIQ